MHLNLLALIKGRIPCPAVAVQSLLSSAQSRLMSAARFLLAMILLILQRFPLS